MIRLSTTYKYIIKKIEKKGKKNGMSYIKLDVKDKECRICLLGGKRSEKLRKYCVCNTGYFHEKCLKKWITSKGDIQCEVCLNDFKNVKVTETKKNIDRYLLWVLVFIWITVLIVLWLAYYNLDKENIKKDIALPLLLSFYYTNIFPCLYKILIKNTNYKITNITNVEFNY